MTLRSLLHRFTYATGYCTEPMCMGTLDHGGDHYVMRQVNGKSVLTRWSHKTMPVLAAGSGHKSQEGRPPVERQSFNPSPGEEAVSLPATPMPVTRRPGFLEIPSDVDGATPPVPSSSLGRPDGLTDTASGRSTKDSAL